MALYAFDGTWNTDTHGPRRQTNVLRFYNAYKGKPDVSKFYFRGIGNRDDYNALLQIVGGVSGFGGKGIIQKAYGTLAREFATRGESALQDLDIVGFSRGAALALHFANAIRKRGIPIRGSEKWEVTYKRRPGRKGPLQKTKRLVYQYHKLNSPLRFLGLWDTVASFGIPGNDVNLGYDLDVPGGVKKACHAMALDEKRKGFALTRLPGADEVWFMGRHTNVGGGHEDRGLSDLALAWMVKKAQNCSLEFYKNGLADIAPDPSGSLSDSGGTSPRIVYVGDKAHQSVVKSNYGGIDWDAVRIVS